MRLTVAKVKACFFRTMQTQKIDTIYLVQTPEAIDIILRPAGILVRSCAFMIDWTIRFLSSSILILLILFLPVANGAKIALIFLILFTALWLYHVLFEVFWHGQTPGKKIMNIRTVQDNGSPMTFSTSLIRNLLRTIDTLPMFYVVGMGLILYSPRAQRLGDLFSGSMVVYLHQQNPLPRPKVLRNLTPMQPPYPISREEEQAIISFADRFDKLSPTRQAELAEELGFFLDLPEHERTQGLLSIANYLLGEQANNEVRR